LKVFAKLDEVEKDKKGKELAEHLKNQIMDDKFKSNSYQNLGEVVVGFMEELRGKAQWTAADADHALALLDVSDEVGAVGNAGQELANQAQKDGMVLKSPWLSGVRAIVTAASLGLLTWIMSNKAAEMEWYETLALAGQMCEGFATLSLELSALGKTIKHVHEETVTQASEKLSLIKEYFADKARWVYANILAPIGRKIVAVATWLCGAVRRFGGQLITGIRTFASTVANGIKKGLVVAYEATIGKAVVL
jgi:hypothetical protein